MLRKHWTTILGMVFFLAAFIYLLKISLQSDWMTPGVKIFIGLAFSAGLLVAGAQFVLRNHKTVGECLAGAGVAFTLTTFSFAGVYYDLWSSMVVFVSMVVCTAVFTTLAYQYDLRIMMNVSLLGGLLAPLLLRPETDQVFTLFLYMLILNSGTFFIAVQRRWTELYVVSFVGTWTLFSVYMLHFEPAVTHWWALPMRYATATFVFYVIAFAWSAWKIRKSFDGLNVYLGIINGLLFLLWSLGMEAPLFKGLLCFVGIVYLLVSWTMHTLERRLTPVFLIFAVGGALLIFSSATLFVEGLAYETVLYVFLWFALATLSYVIGVTYRLPTFDWIARLTWFILVVYWFSTTWDTPRGEWFGVYIPFLNTGALAWFLLAALGFLFTLRPVEDEKKTLKEAEKNFLSYIFGIISHLIIGGLITVQIGNIWEEYTLDQAFLALAYSVSWGMYALSLFFWGTWYKRRFYEVCGSVVLVLVSIKAILFDLSGAETYYKVIVLLILGCISIAFSYLKSKANARNAQSSLTPPAPEERTP